MCTCRKWIKLLYNYNKLIKILLWLEKTHMSGILLWLEGYRVSKFLLKEWSCCNFAYHITQKWLTLIHALIISEESEVVALCTFLDKSIHSSGKEFFVFSQPHFKNKGRSTLMWINTITCSDFTLWPWALQGPTAYFPGSPFKGNVILQLTYFTFNLT